MEGLYNFLADNYILFIIISVFLLFVLIGSIVTFFRNRKKDDPSLQPIDMEKVNEEMKMEENSLPGNISPSSINETSVISDETNDVPSLDQFQVQSDIDVKIIGHDDNNKVASEFVEIKDDKNNEVVSEFVEINEDKNQNVNLQSVDIGDGSNSSLENVFVIEDNSSSENK